MKKIIILIFAFAIQCAHAMVPFGVSSQRNEDPSPNSSQNFFPVYGQTGQGDPPDPKIIHDIESGVIAGRLQTFAKHFGRQVYLSLQEGESGYYSANQAFFILQNFLSNHRVLNFRFSTVKEIEVIPYATGGGTFMVHGSVESFQIYISLGQENDRWVITQFNVY